MRHLLAALAALCLLLPGAAAAATILKDPTPAALTAAFKGAACGAELQVSGSVAKWRPGTPAWDCTGNPVVLSSADPAAPLVFTGGLTMDAWKGVTFRGVVCDIRSGAAAFAGCFLSQGVSSGITIEDSEIFGVSDPTTLASGAVEIEGIGYGVAGRYSGLTIRRNHFHDLAKGIVLGDSDRVSITDNDITNVTVDGIVFGGLQDGEILRNLITKKSLLLTSTAHPDVIQGLLGGRPSVRVRIADNLGVGAADLKGSQGVFLGDDAGLERILVENNLMLRTGYRAFSAGGLSVDILRNAAWTDRAEPSGLYFTAAAGTVSGNTVGAIVGGPAGLTTTNTLTAKRVTAAEIDAAQAAWMAKFRAPPKPEAPPVVVAPDPRDEQIAALEAQVATLTGRVDALTAQLAGAAADNAALKARIDRLLAQRAQALTLAKQARAAKAKNQYLDPLVALLSAPAP